MSNTEITTEWARRIRVTDLDSSQRVLLAVAGTDGSDEVRASLRRDEAKILAAALDPDRVSIRGHLPGTVGHELEREIDRLTTERNRYRDQVRQVGRELSLLGDEADRLRKHVKERGERVDRLTTERDENGEPRPEVTEDVISRIVAEVTAGDWTRQDLVDALWAEVSGENRRIEDAAVAAFKTAWHVADEMDDTGNRVRRGLRAALDTIDNYEQGKSS